MRTSLLNVSFCGSRLLTYNILSLKSASTVRCRPLCHKAIKVASVSPLQSVLSSLPKILKHARCTSFANPSFLVPEQGFLQSSRQACCKCARQLWPSSWCLIKCRVNAEPPNKRVEMCHSFIMPWLVRALSCKLYAAWLIYLPRHWLECLAHQSFSSQFWCAGLALPVESTYSSLHWSPTGSNRNSKLHFLALIPQRARLRHQHPAQKTRAIVTGRLAALGR